MSLKGAFDVSLVDIDHVTDYFTGLSPNSSIVPGAGRCGRAALRNTNVLGGGPWVGIETDEEGGYAGYAVKTEDAATPHLLITINTENIAVSVKLFLITTAAGGIDVWKGPNEILGTRLGGTADGVISTTEFVPIGLSFRFNASVGYARIYVDGELAFDTGLIDTTEGRSPGQWNIIHFREIGYQTDWYFGDTEGVAPWNDYMGDKSAQGQVVSTDAVGGGGTYREWTPSSGTDHGALLDDIPPDDGATTVDSSTIGQRETGKFPSIIPRGGLVDGIVWLPNLSKQEPGYRVIGVLRIIDGHVLLGDDQSLASETWRYYPEVDQAHPVSAARLTVAQVNAAQGGPQVTA